jgi:hypothetical protein
VVEDLLRARPDQHTRSDDVVTAALVVVESVEALIHASIELPLDQATRVQQHTSDLILRYLGSPRVGGVLREGPSTDPSQRTQCLVRVPHSTTAAELPPPADE